VGRIEFEEFEEFEKFQMVSSGFRWFQEFQWFQGFQMVSSGFRLFQEFQWIQGFQAFQMFQISCHAERCRSGFEGFQMLSSGFRFLVALSEAGLKGFRCFQVVSGFLSRWSRSGFEGFQMVSSGFKSFRFLVTLRRRSGMRFQVSRAEICASGYEDRSSEMPGVCRLAA
jgi:hypothetical protein